MARQRPPFENTKKGIALNLDADERHLIRRLIGEIKELLSNAEIGDPKMIRLFPPAYSQDQDAETEYQRLMREELVTSRLDSIARVDEVLADETLCLLTRAQLDSFAAAVNSIRLVLGTLLDVGEEDEEDDDDETHTNSSEMALYDFLSWLLDCAVTTLMQFQV